MVKDTYIIIDRMKYYTKREIKDVRPAILEAIEKLGINDLPKYLNEKILRSNPFTETEIEALLSDDIKISRERYERFLGNMEGMLHMFLFDIARDTLRERRRRGRKRLVS